MAKLLTAVLYIYLVFSLFVISLCAPKPQDDNDLDNEDALPNMINQNLDYNTVFGHVKDLFMYLPVMFTTLRETMTGFPKLAQGFQMLTSPQGTSDDDCKCKSKGNAITKDLDFD